MVAGIDRDHPSCLAGSYPLPPGTTPVTVHEDCDVGQDIMLVYGVKMSHDDPRGSAGGKADGHTAGWTSAPGLDDVIAGFAREVGTGRPAGAITEELLESLSLADQRELLVVLIREELLRRAGQLAG